MGPLSKKFEQKISQEAGLQIIRDFWKGDLAAQKENINRFGKEPIEIGAPNADYMGKILASKMIPISEWNQALSAHILKELEAAIEKGLSPSQLSSVIKARAPDILNTKKITIEKEGKRPITMSTSHYVDLLSRTVPFSVRNAGYISRMRQFSDRYSGWKSICPDDERSCEECVEKMKESEKKPFSWDDRAPPYHPNCFLPDTYCIPPGIVINGMKSFYEGPVVELTFSNGARLAITPNHLILTPYGFAPAYLLAKGDKVLYSSGFKGAIPLDPNNNGKITTIDKIFDSLLKSSGVITRTMPSSTEYFHGDAKFIKEYIDIVWTNGLLRSTFDTISCKAGNAFRFDLGYNSLGFDSLSSFTESFKTLRSIFLSSVSGISEPDPFFLRRLPHSSEHSFASVSDLNILREKLSFDNISRTREAVSQFFNRHSGVIETNEIINVDIISYHGCVYDLETTSSFLICNGVIASNCRCRPLAVMAEEEGPEPIIVKPPEKEFTFVPDTSSNAYAILTNHKILYGPGPATAGANYSVPLQDIRNKLGENFLNKRELYTYWYFKDLEWTSKGSEMLKTEPREYRGGIYVQTYGKYKENTELLNKSHIAAALSQRLQWDIFGELIPESGTKTKSGHSWDSMVEKILNTGEDKVKINEEMNFAAISTRFFEAGNSIDIWKKLSQEIYENHERDVKERSRDILQGEVSEFLELFKEKGYFSRMEEGQRVTYIDDILLGDAKAASLSVFRAKNAAEWEYGKQVGAPALFNFVDAKGVIMADVVKALGTEDMSKVNRITNTVLAEWANLITMTNGGANKDYRNNNADMSDLFNRTIMMNYLSPELAQEHTPITRTAIYTSMKEGALSKAEAAPLRELFSGPRPEKIQEIESLPEIIRKKPLRSILDEFPNQASTLADIINVGSTPESYILDFKPQVGKPLFEFATISGAFGDCNTQGNHIRINSDYINTPQGRYTAVHEYAHLVSYNLPIVDRRAVYRGYGGGVMRTFNPTNPKIAATARIQAFNAAAEMDITLNQRWEAVKNFKQYQDEMQYLNAVGPYPLVLDTTEERIAELQEIRKNIDDFLLEEKISLPDGSTFHHGEMTLYGVLPMTAESEAEQISSDAFKVIKGLKEGKPRNVGSGMKSNPSYVDNKSFIVASSDLSAWENAPEGSILVKFDLKGAHAVPINENEWLIGRSHSLMFRRAAVAGGKTDRLGLTEQQLEALKGRSHLTVWVDPPAPEERAIERRCSFVDRYGEKANFDLLAQNFGTTPKQAEQWFNDELAKVGKMVRLSVVIDKETDGEVGAFDEVLKVTDEWSNTLKSGRWPVEDVKGPKWEPDLKQIEVLYNKMLKLPKGHIQALLDAIKDPVMLNKSFSEIGRMTISDRQLKEFDELIPKLDDAIARVKTTADMSFFARYNYNELNLKKGSTIPPIGYVFGKNTVEELMTLTEKAVVGSPDFVQLEMGGFMEIRLPKGSNALTTKRTTVIGRDIELEYIRSYDYMPGIRIAIFQPKGANTDPQGLQKTVPDLIEEEISKLTVHNPSLAAINQAKYVLTAKFSPGAGKPDVGLTNFKEVFAKEFPSDYDPLKREDILNYYLKNWLDRAGDNLYSATKEWQTSAEERWAMFVQGVYMDPSQVEKLAPEPYQAFMRKLDEDGYGSGLKKILGRPEKIALADEGIGVVNVKEIEETLSNKWNSYKGNLSVEQVDKIATWRSDFYKKINGYHRGTEALTPEEYRDVYETSNLIDGAMSEIGKENEGYIVAYRGFSHPELIEKWDRIEGAIIENPGYTTVSLDSQVAKKYAAKDKDGIIAEMRISPKIEGLYVDAVVGPEEGEKEILLRRDLRYNVKRRWIDEEGQRRMIIEVG
jgi:hypothetical protein